MEDLDYRIEAAYDKFIKKMAATPGITKQDREVFKYDGNDFYTNEKLRQKFIIAINRFLPPTGEKKIKELIKKKIIIPAFLTSSGFSWFKRNMQDVDQIKYKDVMGMYLTKQNKILVLVDSGYKFFGYVPDEHLAEVTLHECMHMAAKKQSAKFYTQNITPLYKYYDAFLTRVFQLKKSDKKAIIKWILFLHKYETGNAKGLTVLKYKKYLKDIAKGNTKLKDEDIENISNFIVGYLVGTFTAKSNSSFTSTIRNYRPVFNALLYAYEKAFNFKAKTVAYQELLVPSEVICMIASTKLGDSKYVVDNLNLLA